MRHSVIEPIQALAVLVMLIGPATAAEFFPLGDLPGGKFHSYATGVSDGGSAVVGYSEYSADGIDREAFRWTQETGMVGLGSLDFRFSKATDASADGSVVAGYVDFPGPRQSFRWTQDDGMEIIGPGSINGVSADGSIIVGNDNRGAYLWTRKTGVELLSSWPGGDSWRSARGLSADGSVLLVDDFRWTPPSDPIRIEQPNGRYPRMLTLAVSADGSTVVGGMGNTRDLPSRYEAFRWTENDGTVPLGDLPGDPFESFAYGVSGDGSIVVGHANFDDDTWVGGDAFIWDADNGMRNLQEVLVQDYDLGFSLEGWTLHHAESVSTDGNVIVGYGTNPNGNTEAWRVVLSPKEIPVDLNKDGSVDVADADVLVGEILAGADNAAFDVSGDGVVDQTDLTDWLFHAATHNGFSAAYLLGDSDLDGTVMSADLNSLALNWQQKVSTWSDGDFTADGRVDSADLNALALNWQQIVPMASTVSAAVPEPSTWLLLTIAGLTPIWRRPRSLMARGNRGVHWRAMTADTSCALDFLSVFLTSL